MKHTLFVLCTLGFMGLQGAHRTPPTHYTPSRGATATVVAGSTQITLEQTPDYETHQQHVPGFAQASAPSSLDEFNDDILLDELARRGAQREYNESLAALAKNRKSRNEPAPNPAHLCFRSTGSLSVASATRNATQLATSASTDPHADTSDTEDTFGTLRIDTHSKEHRRQRSASDTEALVPPAPEQLRSLAQQINNPHGDVALAAVTAFEEYRRARMEQIEKKSGQLEQLLTCLLQKQTATVTPQEPTVRFLPTRQKEVDNLQRGARRISQEMISVSDQLANLTKDLRSKTQEIAKKK